MKNHIYRFEYDHWWKCYNCQGTFTDVWPLCYSIYDPIYGECGVFWCPFCYSENIKLWCPGCDDPEHLEKPKYNNNDFEEDF